MNLGAYYALSQDAKAIEFLKSAAKLDPDDGEVRFNLGLVLAAAGKYQDAVRELEAAEKRGVKNARETIKQIQEGFLDKGDKLAKE